MQLAGVARSPACGARPTRWGPELEVERGLSSIWRRRLRVIARTVQERGRSQDRRARGAR
eukprot:3933293-Pyramimonas_sp.AAC.1